jgi:DNA polymerase-3 subunit alpha
MTAPFVHLRLHTEYSLVDGLIRIKSLVKQVAAAGMPAVAVTDMSNLFALIKFYKAALSAGIKPIVGVDAWVRRQRRTDAVGAAVPEPDRLSQPDPAGQSQLSRRPAARFADHRLRLADRKHRRFDRAVRRRDGELGQALLNDRGAGPKPGWRTGESLFPERFYLEVQRTGRPQEEEYLDAVVDLAAATGTPVVATNEVCFLKREDFEAHEARVCIHDGVTLDDPRRPRRYSDQQYLRTPAEMADAVRRFARGAGKQHRNRPPL